jgi:hypothetical protein
MISRNIAMRGYAPTCQEREAISASMLLYLWTQAILDELNIDINEDILTTLEMVARMLRH